MWWLVKIPVDPCQGVSLKKIMPCDRPGIKEVYLGDKRGGRTWRRDRASREQRHEGREAGTEMDRKTGGGGEEHMGTERGNERERRESWGGEQSFLFAAAAAPNSARCLGEPIRITREPVSAT